MKTQVTTDIRRAFLALSGVVVVMLSALVGISVLVSRDANTRLVPLYEQAVVLANAQDQLLNLLVIEQNWLDRRTGAGGKATEAEIGRRDELLQGLNTIVQQVSATLQATRAIQSDYASLTGLTAVWVLLLILALVALAVAARERILKPLGKLARLLGRLAREDYRPEPIDGVDAVFRPAFESYNRLVGRLTRLENAHRARHNRMETQVREATRALVAQRAELARVERLAAVGEVAASLAHEVRNPLAAIRSACRSLIEETSEEDTRERLKMIDDEVERLVGFVNEQLRATRHQPEAPERTDVTRLIRSLVRLMKYQMPHSVALRMELPANLVAHLPPNGLRQALLNLIRNSHEALEGQSGSITIAMQQREWALEISVQDSGSGFPAAVLAAGVHRFATGKKGGTGLGLAMVDRFVRDQGGKMELENCPEGGARVRITLPNADDRRSRVA